MQTKIEVAMFLKVYIIHFMHVCFIIIVQQLYFFASKAFKDVDSTTISLFSDILKEVGRKFINGKKKGGIMMHTMINIFDDVPCLLSFSSAAIDNHTFIKELNLEKGFFDI